MDDCCVSQQATNDPHAQDHGLRSFMVMRMWVAVCVLLTAIVAGCGQQQELSIVVKPNVPLSPASADRVPNAMAGFKNTDGGSWCSRPGRFIPQRGICG